MYFLIETNEQLRSLEVCEECFVQVIPDNYNYNPSISKPCLFYYRNKEKGYILAVNHSETLTMDLREVTDFIEKHPRVYVFDKKMHSKYFNTENCVDLCFVELELGGEIDSTNFMTDIQIDYDRKFYDISYLNKLVPVTKHYEHLEKLYNHKKYLIKRAERSVKLDRLVEAYAFAESNPITVRLEEFLKVNTISHASVFCVGNKIYNSYNLYNQTGRPTNSFNGFNFLAVPKKEEFRKCIIPNNDLLVEFDFDAYHVRLLAKELGIELPKTSVHEYLARQYYGKQDISEEEYKHSKTETFAALYGSALGKHLDIPIIGAIHNMSQDMQRRYESSEFLELPTGIKLKKSVGPTPEKAFNYYVQNLETSSNVEKVLGLKRILEGKKTKLILITYDSFLFDYSLEDGKKLLLDIKSELEVGGTPVKHKHGKDYNF